MFARLRRGISRLFASSPPPAPPVQQASTPVETRAPEPQAPIAAPPAAAPPSELEVPTQASVPAEDEPILLQREVLDAELNVVGYDFALREDPRQLGRTHARPVRDFLSRILVDQLAALDGSLFRSRIAHLQLGEHSMMRLGIGKLPGRCSVLLAPDNPDRPADSGIRDAIEALCLSGREVWLDDCLGTPWFGSLADLATGAVVRLALRMPDETAGLIKTARERYQGIRFAAWDVATFDDFEMARQLACRRFSGPFVSRREDWTSNEISPQMLSVGLLINKVRQEADMRAIAQVLKQDMALSYRLLRYINNAAYGLNHKISSIEQGLMVLGQNQLDRWLTLLMLSGGAMGNVALTEMSLQRARFLELLGAGRLPPDQCERLFVLGLFSMLDVALKLPLDKALAPLHLPEVMSQALLRREGPFGPYLALADACEKGITMDIIRNAVMLGLTTSKVSARQIEAVQWVADVTAQQVNAMTA